MVEHLFLLPKEESYCQYQETFEIGSSDSVGLRNFEVKGDSGTATAGAVPTARRSNGTNHWIYSGNRFDLWNGWCGHRPCVEGNVSLYWEVL